MHPEVPSSSPEQLPEGAYLKIKYEGAPIRHAFRKYLSYGGNEIRPGKKCFLIRPRTAKGQMEGKPFSAEESAGMSELVAYHVTEEVRTITRTDKNTYLVHTVDHDVVEISADDVEVVRAPPSTYQALQKLYKNIIKGLFGS